MDKNKQSFENFLEKRRQQNQELLATKDNPELFETLCQVLVNSEPKMLAKRLLDIYSVCEEEHDFGLLEALQKQFGFALIDNLRLLLGKRMIRGDYSEWAEKPSLKMRKLIFAFAE